MNYLHYQNCLHGIWASEQNVGVERVSGQSGLNGYPFDCYYYQSTYSAKNILQFNSNAKTYGDDGNDGGDDGNGHDGNGHDGNVDDGNGAFIIIIHTIMVEIQGS